MVGVLPYVLVTPRLITRMLVIGSCWSSGSLGPQLDEIRTAIGWGLGSIHDGLGHFRRRKRLEFSDFQGLEHARVIAAGTGGGIDHPGCDFGDLDAVTLQLDSQSAGECRQGVLGRAIDHAESVDLAGRDRGHDDVWPRRRCIIDLATASVIRKEASTLVRNM